MWIGNESAEELKLECSEICGFNLGSYEEKAVTGPLHTEISNSEFCVVSIMYSNPSQLPFKVWASRSSRAFAFASRMIWHWFPMTGSA